MNNSIKIYSPNTPLSTDISLPASKSISNRALIINALSYSPYDITNLSDCDDTQVLLQALSSNSNEFDIKAAGTAMRFLTAFLSKIVGEWTITGTERMRNRPIKPLVDALISIGARIEYLEKDGFPPLRIYGSVLQGGEIELDGSISSQYISALLMVAPMMEKGLTLKLSGRSISKPYVSLTLSMMKQFGIQHILNKNTICIPANQNYSPVPFTVESDWSAASYWYEIMAFSPLGSEIMLLGLDEKSMQGDSRVYKLFEQLGVSSTFTDKGVLLKRKELECKNLNINFVNEPDIAQTFAVLCIGLNIPFHFTGLQSLKIKETDRIEALRTEIKKLGCIINVIDDSAIEWNGEKGKSKICPIIETYDDHRMAMSFAPLASKLREGLRIANPQVVTKSYPLFWQHMEQAGFHITK